ncbi:MAG: response regulator, partial [Thermoplasmatota archaeon]
PYIVLVVDDEDTMQDLIHRNLSLLDLDIKVHAALTGEEGVKRYRELMGKDLTPDLVIMDLNLTQWGDGEIDGVEATRQILDIDPKARIYGYTAWFATRWAQELEQAGAKDVIERTTLPSDFRKMIADILTRT